MGNLFPSRVLLSLSGLSLLLLTGTSVGAGLTASDGAGSDSFGYSVSQSGGIGLSGAFSDDIGAYSDQGSAYVFRNLDTANGSVTQNVKLTASGVAYPADDYFGISVSLSGNIGLVGAYSESSSTMSDIGAAYVFRNLDTATGTVTQNVKLIASDSATGTLGVTGDHLGGSVSLSGSIGLVGAEYDDIGGNYDQGSAYVFRNLNTATGTVTQNAKLIASDGTYWNQFGHSVSLSGNIGLINGGGGAYIFRNLDTVTGTITQNVKLVAFGGSIYTTSLSGSIGLTGNQFDDIGDNSDQGSACVFRNLDIATGTVTQNVELIASDGAASDGFGASVSQSGNIGLVGSSSDDIGANSNQGSAYIFHDLDTATETVNQNVKLTASDGAASDRFGSSVSMDGDQFVIGAYGKNSSTGKAYSGSVSSITSLDTGSTSKTISGISFSSQDDWIIGQATDANQVPLSAGDSANVTASGKAVFIGKNAGADNNTLIVAGSLTANEVNIGTASNLGNTLKLTNTGTLTASAIKLADLNYFSIQGDYTNINTLLAYLGSTPLETLNGVTWQTVTAGNYASKISSSYSSGFTTITPIPEPLDLSFTSLGIAALTSNGYTATGLTLGAVTLGFVPGAQLTLINNISANAITGTFANLTQGGILILTYGGQSYIFTADYSGGDGNDLVLTANTPPTFSGRALSTPFQTSTSISFGMLLSQAADADADALAVSAAGSSAAPGGSTVLLADSILYTPPAGFSGIDTFPVTITDAPGDSVIGLVTVTVGEPNLSGGTSQAVRKFNDSISSGGSSASTLIAAQTYLITSSVGVLAATPGSAGSLSVGSGFVATLSTQLPVNTPPTFAGYTLSTPYQTTASISFGKLKSKAADADGDAISVSTAGSSTSQGGMVAMQSSAILYSPPTGFSGTDTFPVSVTDARGAYIIGTVTVTVQPNTGVGLNSPLLTKLSGGRMGLAFQGIPGRSYEIQRSTDLIAWQTLTTVTASTTNGAVSFIDESPPVPSGYYRLRKP